MLHRKLVTNKMKSRFQKNLIFLAMFLILINGMYPTYSIPVEALEKDDKVDIVLPEVSKTINHEESKEIEMKEEFAYMVNVLFPEDLSGYESIIINDELDSRLQVIDSVVQVDGIEIKKTEQFDEILKAKVDGQKVSFNLEFTDEKREELVGKELTLQITAQMRVDMDTGGAIESVAG